ncbi:MAG TPA: phosphotransferase [Solirubrobacterales bacterium]|nr:phosphotransferase [Solirubrobacterales bacterium]
MSGALRASGDEQVREALERALGEVRGQPVAVTELSRRPFAYETSFAIDALDVALASGERLALLVKDVGPDGLSPGAAAAKPAHTLDPNREIAVYRDLLEPAALSTPGFHGAAVDPDPGRWWLFLERIDGEVLTDVGEVSIWCDTAAWAARLGGVDGTAPSLLHRDSSWHRHWIGAAIVRLREGGTSDRETAEALDRHGSELAERLSALPQAFVHGELYPANVLVERTTAGPARIAPVDWELAGTGPYTLDLAALVGGWSGEDRLAIYRAFHRALPPERQPAFEELTAAVDLCRLALALQWIGWSADWVAPQAQRHDWRGEAALLLQAVGP